MKKTCLTALCITLAVSACDVNYNDKSGVVIAQKPTIDLTTPDKSIKSYWGLKDWVKDNERQLVLSVIQKNMEYVTTGVLPTVSLSGVKAYFSRSIEQSSSLSKLKRKIESVKQETESRAIVVARIMNDDPIPQGVVMSEEDKKNRELGTIFKYVLEKDKDGWKVAEVYEVDPILGREEEPYRIQEPSAPIYVFSD